MDFIKIIGIGLLSLIIIVILRQYKPEFVIYVSIISGMLILTLVFSKIAGIIEIINNLTSKISIHQEFIALLIKITGIAILTEFAVSICKDTGESSIANKIDMGGKVVIISMSIPILAGLLETINKILP